MNFIDCNGRSIHYKYIKGSGEQTFLFVNSLGTDFRIWDVVAELVKHEGSVLLFDKPGHGLSETSENHNRIAHYVSDIVFLLDALEISKCVFVGLSIGGLMGQFMALHYPERIEKLLISNSAPKTGAVDFWNARIETIREGGMTAMSDKILERWLSDYFRKNKLPETAGLKRMLENCSVNGYISACEAIRDEDLSNEIQQINLPVLCIGGSEDKATLPEAVYATAKKIPGAEVIIIPGAGHLPCVEAPAVFAQHLLQFAVDAPSSLYDKGMKTRRAVLGNAHVNRAEANKTDFDRDFQEYITNNAWGAIWSRPGLTKRERSLITIALLAALKHNEELEMHIRATKNTGATEGDVKEVLLHTGIYAGVPVTNGAMKIAKEVFTTND